MPTQLSRRDFLRLAGLVSASTALAACAPAYARLGGPAEPAADNLPPALSAASYQALNRLTFGPRVADRARLSEIGLAGWIEEQLAPATIDDGPADWRLRQFETLRLSADDLAVLGDQLFDDVDKLSVPAELRQATLLRQVFSRRQLYEVMVEFWSDHFHISVDKGDCWFLKTVDDREVIRPHALGSFRDLLWASAHSPAMLVYLDNQANLKEAPNENYARELLELHTLGVNGGYTQGDVMELARALTGWTVKDKFWRGDFTFNPDFHDPNPKTVLGLRLQVDGQREAEVVLEHIASHPATARHIAYKLARRFVADDPPAELVDRAAQSFTVSDGDITAVLRVLLLDGLAGPTPVAQPKIKRPIHFVASALRHLNAETDAGPALHEFLARMGQPYFGWPTPDGYPDYALPWAGNLMPRWQFALALARGEISGTTFEVPAALADQDPSSLASDLSNLILGQPIAPEASAALLAGLDAAGATSDELPGILTAGYLAAPAFQWR